MLGRPCSVEEHDAGCVRKKTVWSYQEASSKEELWWRGKPTTWPPGPWEWLRHQHPIFCGSHHNLSPLPPSEAAWKTKGFLSRYAASTFNTQIYLSWIQTFSHTLSPWPLLHQKPSPLSIPKTMSCHPCSHLPLPLNHNIAAPTRAWRRKVSTHVGQSYL